MPHLDRLRFYWALYKLALAARAEYRLDFLVAVLTAILSQLSVLAFYWIVFSGAGSSAPALGGWPAGGVLFLYSLCALILGVSELAFNGIWSLPSYIVSGELDRLLVYPVRSLPFLLIARPELHALGNVATGVVLLGTAWAQLSLPTVVLLVVPLWVACGVVIYTSALVLMGCLSFCLVGPWSYHFTFVHQLLSACRYPVTIYPRAIQVLLLTLFPIGVVTFVPGQWLLAAGSPWPALLGPVAAAGTAATIVLQIWQRSERNYESTGS